MTASEYHEPEKVEIKKKLQEIEENGEIIQCDLKNANITGNYKLVESWKSRDFV